MMKAIKVVLSLFIFLIALATGLNVPVIASGMQEDCNYSTGSCSTFTNYQSIMDRYFYPVTCNACGENVKTVTLSSGELYSGNLANSTSGATAYLNFSLNNPESATYITSLTLSSSGVATVTQKTFYNGTSEEAVTNATVWVYSTTSESGKNLTTTSWDDDSQPSGSQNFINFNSKSSSYENAIPSGRVTTYTYYPAVTSSSSFEEIFAGQVYNYVITFANGQSVSGSLNAISSQSNSIQSASLSSSSSASSATQSKNSFQVVRTNVVVQGMPAYLGFCIAFLVFCGTAPIQNYSLTVNLIKYNGTYYYEHTMTGTEVPGNSAVGSGINASNIAGSQTTAYTTWFTNTTVYCVTPEMNTVPTCPTLS
jgi:hypothetical protein